MASVSFIEDHPIYGITSPQWIWTGKNEPACYTKNQFEQVGGEFSHSLDLIQEVEAYVDVEGEGGIGYLPDTSVLFTTENCIATSNHRSTERLPDEIGEYTRTLNWKYRVPSGSNNWINMQDNPTGLHTIYTVYDAPKCTASDYTKGHIDWACSKAAGESAIVGIGDSIWSGLNADPPLDGHDDIQSDDWNLLQGSPYQGDCDNQARFMNKILKLLGISTSTPQFVYASSDGEIGDCISMESRGWLKKEPKRVSNYGFRSYTGSQRECF